MKPKMKTKENGNQKSQFGGMRFLISVYRFVEFCCKSSTLKTQSRKSNLTF